MLQNLFRKSIFSLLFLGLPVNASSNYGYASLKGHQPAMNNAYFAKINHNYAFYSVFDGNGGNFVARYLALKLYFNIINSANFKASPLRAIMSGCLLTNQDLPSLAEYQGSTAIMALIKNNQIYLGNVGNSRAVLCRSSLAQALSQDHKPDRSDEYKRITELGGYVTNHGGVSRVQGVLPISRSFGNFSLKPYVIAQPETSVHHITPQDEFLILACDGVWNMFSNQQAVNIVRTSLQKNHEPKTAAQALVDAAYAAGSMDNISVLVICLK